MCITQPAVLTIGEADSGGGAGIQADLKTFTAHGCYGTSVTVALTAQNSKGVQAVYPLPPAFVKQQLRSVLDDIDVKAIKTGMLFDAASIRTIVGVLRSYYHAGRNMQEATSMPPLICDPECVSSSGDTFLSVDALHVLVSELFPLTTVLTLETAEAERILSARGAKTSEITDLESMLADAKRLLLLGPKNVLLMSGQLSFSFQDIQRTREMNPDLHLASNGLYDENMEILQMAEEVPFERDRKLAVDLLQESEGTTLYLRPQVDAASARGIECTLSAALTCELSRHTSVRDAVTGAIEYTYGGIPLETSVTNRQGRLDHMHSLTSRVIPIATTSNPYPFLRILIQANAHQWKQYVEHDFVKQLALGTLPRECFLHFTKQGTLYLKYYARAHGLLSAKCASFAQIKPATTMVIDVIKAVSPSNTSRYKWGITEEEFQSTPESTATIAYGSYLMDCGLRGDAMALTMSAAACLLGYGEVGLWFKRERQRPGTWVVVEGNPYVEWVEEYGSEAYQESVRAGIAIMESFAAADPPSPSRFEEWRSIWERCIRLEKGFWDMALAQAY